MIALAAPWRAAMAALLWIIAGYAGAAEATRPNFLVILCDDLGYGDLACFGHPTIRSPNLDRLAAQGLRLTSCYSAAPVCSSSRCGLLTGRTPARVGIYDWINEGNVVHLPTTERTIATVLRSAGYATCQVGKWHLNGKFNDAAQPQPGDHGFEHWLSTQNNAAPNHQNPTNFVRNGQPVGPMTGFSCQLVADEAIGWLEKRRAEQPFFMYVCFHEPHEPIESPKELVASYTSAENENQAQYFANVTNMDAAVGRLLAKLDDLKLADNTLVYFSSDNGPETLKRYKAGGRSYGSPGPLRGMKLHLYEGGFRVPGIVRWPAGIKPAQTVDEPVCSLDLLPTFCGLAGVPAPTDRELDGVDISPLLRGQAFARSQPLFWHYFHSIGQPKAALRQGDWMILGHWNVDKLPAGSSIQPGHSEIIKAAQLTKFELYNLRDDLAEAHDLATTNPERLSEMIALIQAKYAEVLREAPVWKFPE